MNKNYNSVNYSKAEDKKLDNLALFKNKEQDIDDKSSRIALIYVQGTIV